MANFKGRVQEQLLAGRRKWDRVVSAGATQDGFGYLLVSALGSIECHRIRVDLASPFGDVFSDEPESFDHRRSGETVCGLKQRAGVTGVDFFLIQERLARRCVYVAAHGPSCLVRACLIMPCACVPEGLVLSPATYMAPAVEQAELIRHCPGIDVALDPPPLAVRAFHQRMTCRGDEFLDLSEIEQWAELLNAGALDWDGVMAMASNDAIRLNLRDRYSTVRFGLTRP